MQLEDKEWIDAVVTGEDIVQREDMHMCDLVQGGLASPAYDVGRCAALLPHSPNTHYFMREASAKQHREKRPHVPTFCTECCTCVRLVAGRPCLSSMMRAPHPCHAASEESVSFLQSTQRTELHDEAC